MFRCLKAVLQRPSTFPILLSGNNPSCSTLHAFQKVKRALHCRHCLIKEPKFKTYISSAQYSTAAGNGPLEVTRENSREILEKYDTLLIDCDGVLWKIDHVTPLPGIQETMSRLRDTRKQILFVTNNSMHGREMYVDKFRKYGFEARGSEVFCVAYAAAIYLKTVAKISKAVYVSGSRGMQSELEQAGIDAFGFGPDRDQTTDDVEQLLQMEFRDDVEAVLVGFDIHFSYNKIYKAASYLTSPDCLYLATNSLETGPLISINRRQPVTGTMVAAISAASKREPLVIGKPSCHMFECIQTMYPTIDKSRTLMIGDSLRADIQFAQNNGIDSALVLTGVAGLQMVKDTGILPTYYMQSIAVL
ncbi:4-nitrophenylphosphatase-like [Gigantopelta aegis]|uniref:4-nitrophenylphosphatase-like n=1 Tax=Gigantopelta aegis TaxID=1735272 RepID=UPI001B88E321|nr:4-nitrophenylphosphatase-like [Gigantopelta aegis]